MATQRLRLGNPTEDETPMFKSASEAYWSDVAERDRASKQEKSDYTSLGKMTLDALDAPMNAEVGLGKQKTGSVAGAQSLGRMSIDDLYGFQKPAKQEPAKQVTDESGDYMRGAGIALEQTPALLKGAVGLVGATGEKAFGKDGMFSALKNYGFEGFKSGMAEAEAKAKETDDVTKAWDRAKSGEVGALVDWAQYGLGYLTGNVIETALTAIGGSIIGGATAGPLGALGGAGAGTVAKGTAKAFIKDVVESAVSKEAARIAAKEGVEATSASVVKQATKNVAKDIGSGSALLASGVAKGVGTTYGEGQQLADEQGRELDAGDLARMWAAGTAAGVTEAIVDRIGVKAAKGKIEIPGGGRIGKAIVGTAAGGTLEGGTELIQSVLERYGAGKELSGEDAMGEYINSFALGALGGGTIGALTSLRGKRAENNRDRINKLLDDAQEELTSDDGRQELFDSMMRDERMARVLEANGITSSADPRFQTVITQTLAAQRLVNSVNIPTAEQRTETTKQRGEDVAAAFGETASTGVGVGTGTSEPVIQRESVVPNQETRTLEPVGVEPQPVMLPDGKTTAVSGEDIVAKQQGFDVEPTFIVGTSQIANRFGSQAQAETFLFGPVGEDGKRKGGYANSVNDLEFQVRRGQKSKDAGGGSFFFIESRPKAEQATGQAQGGTTSQGTGTTQSSPVPPPATTAAAPAAPAAPPAAPTPAPAPVTTSNVPATPPGAAPAAPTPNLAAVAWDAFGGIKFDALPAATQQEWDEAVADGLKPEVLTALHKNLSAAVVPTQPTEPAVASTPAAPAPVAPPVTTPATAPATATAPAAPAAPAAPVTGKQTVEQKLKDKQKQKKAKATAAPAPAPAPAPTPAPASAPAEGKQTVEDKLKQKEADRKAAEQKAKEDKAKEEQKQTKQEKTDATQGGQKQQDGEQQRQGTGQRLETGRDNRQQQTENKAAGNKAGGGNKPAKSGQKQKVEPESKKVPLSDVIEIWDSNDPEDGTHIKWDDVPADVKADWKAAVEDGYANTPKYDELVQRVYQNQRAERTNAKVAQNKPDDTKFRLSDLGGKGISFDRAMEIVNNIANGWTKFPDIVVVATDFELPAAIQARIDKAQIRGKVKGAFSGGKVYIVAGNHANSNDVALTVFHEVAGHFGLRRILGGDYAKVMNDIYNGNKSVREKADKMAAREGLTREEAVEEVLADMAQDGVTAQNRTALQQLFAYLRKLLRKAGISVVTESDLVELVSNARRYVVKGDIKPGAGEAALGFALRSDTKTASFRKWFGKSKVVGADGEPMIVYHARPGDFGVFDTTLGELGTHFGNKSQANDMAGAMKQGANVVPAYIRIENPYRMVDWGSFGPAEVADQLREDGMIDDDQFAEIEGMSRRNANKALQDILKANGYDGIVYLNITDGLRFPKSSSPDAVRDELRGLSPKKAFEKYGAEDSFIVFDPNQIKSVFNESPTNDPDFLKRQEGAPTFYSALERAFRNPTIKLDKNGAASPQQWKQWLASNKDKLRIKKEEIEWTGINQWLDTVDEFMAGGGEKAKVTQEQILQWIADNRINVNDVTLSNLARPDASQIAVAEIREPNEFDMREFVRDQVADMETDQADFEFISPDDMSVTELRQWIADNHGWGNFLHGFRRSMERFQRGRIEKMSKPKHGEGNLVLSGGSNYAELVLYDPTATLYKPNDDIHFGDVTQGRTIGWLRMKERKDKDGNTVLFLEEIQSQRGQDYRKGQVAKKNREKADQLMSDYVDMVRESSTVERGPERDALMQRIRDNRAEYQRLVAKDTTEYDNVPEGPFIKKTESWTALLIKRAVAYALSRGIDRIAWTTGAQQNERYKFPGDELVYVQQKGSPNVTLTVLSRGRDLQSVEDVPMSNLAAYVGDAAAERIRSGEGLILDNDIERSGSIKGDALSLMQANLQPYYDQTLPNVSNEFLKDFGGTVEFMDIEGTGRQQGFVIPGSLQQTVEEDGLPMFRREDYDSQYDDLPADTRDVAKAKGTPTPPTIRQRLEALKPKLALRLVQGALDKVRSVKDISEKAYMQLRLSTSVDGALEVLLHYGQVFNDDGALNLKKGTKGLIEVLQPLGNETDRFLMWIAANRAAQLKKEDRELFFKDDEIAKLKKINLGTMRDGRQRVAVYADALRGMNELNRSVLDVALKSGLIDEDGYKKFASDVWYVPFYRAMEDGRSDLSTLQSSSGSVNQYFSKMLKGSERPLNDLMQNVLMNWSHILSASMKNAGSREALNAADELSGIVTRLVPINGSMGRDKNGNVVPLKDTVKVMEGGKPVHYDINDPFLMQSLSAVTSMDKNGFLLNIGRSFKTTLTRFVALSPTFKLNNLIRDSVQSIGLTDLGYNPVGNVVQGVKEYQNNRAEALAGGGIFTMGNAFDGDRNEAVKRLIAKGVKDEDIINTPEKAKQLARELWEKYDAVSDAMENANRLALYRQMREKGASHLEAAYAARDIQDFSSMGAWEAIRYANQVLPYFNARLQGLYKIGRDGVSPLVKAMTGKANEAERAKAMKFAATTAAVTATGLILYMSQKDDEEFKKREDWDRDLFFWFRIPGTNRAIRIPKPFEMGAIATIAERALEQIVDKDVEGKVFGQRIVALLSDTFAMNPIPQAIRPLYEIAANKNGLTDAPIETLSQKRLSADERTNPRTSGAAVVINRLNSVVADGIGAVTGVDSENMKLSPIQYDYMLKAYLGWVGTVIQTSSQYAAAGLREGEMPDIKIDDMVLVGNYVRSLPAQQSRYVTDFYKTAERASRAGADFRNMVANGREAEAEKFAEKNASLLELESAYASAKKDLTEINNAIKQIEKDPEMSGAEKRKQMDALYQQRSDLAKEIELARIRSKK